MIGLFSRAKYVIKNEGWIVFIKAMFAFLRYHIFFYRTYYLSEYKLMETQSEELLPLINDYSLKIITNNHQIDELAREGYQFRPWYPIY